MIYLLDTNAVSDLMESTAGCSTDSLWPAARIV